MSSGRFEASPRKSHVHHKRLCVPSPVFMRLGGMKVECVYGESGLSRKHLNVKLRSISDPDLCRICIFLDVMHLSIKTKKLHVMEEKVRKPISRSRKKASFEMVYCIENAFIYQGKLPHIAG